MKYFSKLKLYKAANVTFNPETCEAYSYGWWRFVAVIGGKLVFNNYNYSTTTSGHQRKVRALLCDLGHEIAVAVHAPRGLQDVASAIGYYEREIIALQAAIDKPGTRKAKNAERAAEIERLQAQIAQVRALVRAEARKQAKVEKSRGAAMRRA